MSWKTSILVLTVCGQFLCLHPSLAFQKGGNESDPFTVIYDEGPVPVTPGKSYTFSVTLQIPDDYYLYAESADLLLENPDGIVPGDLQKPEGVKKDDPFFGRVTDVYYNEAVMEVSLQMPPDAWTGQKTVSGKIQYQGCSDKLCYRLMQLPFEVAFTAASMPQTTEIKKGWFKSLASLVRERDFGRITAKGIWLALLVAFIGGLLTDLTPCVWPMIPVTLAIIGIRKDRNFSHNLLAVGVMVLGMSVMYSILGLLAAGAGKSLGFLFQNLVFLILLELVLVFMALSLFGLFDLRLPASLQARLAKIPSTGYRGIFFVGLTMGLFAAPCVGPVVGPLLVFVAATRDLALGFLLLLFYALGMGVLFLVLGAFAGAVKLKIGSGAWNAWLKKALGVLMILVAVYYGRVIYGQMTAVGPPQNGLWITSLDEGMARAAKEKKPAIVDFFAQWCPPCLELDRQVWSRPSIRETLSEKWVAVKIDCTRDTKTCHEAVERFKVIGWPTVVFLDRLQKEAEKERLVGEVVDEREMTEILNRVEGE